MMLGWFRYIWIFSYLINCSVISSSTKSFFSITFRAHMKPVFFYLPLINQLPHQIHPPVFSITQLLYFLEIWWSCFLLYLLWTEKHRGACWSHAFFVTVRSEQFKTASLHASQWILVQKRRYIRFFLFWVLSILFYFHKVYFLFWAEISWLLIVQIVVSELIGFHKIILHRLVALTHSGRTTNGHEFGCV